MRAPGFLGSSLLFLYTAACITSATNAQDNDESQTSTIPDTSSPTTRGDGVSNSTTAKPSISPTSVNVTILTTTTKRPNLVDCPAPCICPQPRVLDCSGKQLTQLPRFDAKSQFSELRFDDNLIESVDLKQLPWRDGIEVLNLSNNRIKTIIPLPLKKSENLSKLRKLNLANNQLDSLVNLTNWKTPELKQLYLGQNLFVKFNITDFSSRSKLERLKLNDLTQLKSLNESTFSPLIHLMDLDLSGSLAPGVHLPDQLFVKNQRLERLDLSRDNLLEVPVALRSTGAIKELILDENLMTSLRQSDFLNRAKLETLRVMACVQLLRVEPHTFSELDNLNNLTISHNPRFFDFSRDAFLKAPGFSDDSLVAPIRELGLLDLSSNNITTMSNPMEFASVKINQLRLASNPWDCSCALEWLVKLPNLAEQQPIHCRTPHKYDGIEIGQYFTMIDCQLEESSLQRFVMILFLLFLIVLTIAVFIQKTDLCRRLQWRDQYGTIYYTKASFPNEQV